MTYNIRRMLKTDAAAVAAVHVASWKSAYRGMIDDELLDAIQVSDREKRWKQNLEGDDYELENIVCLNEENEVIGFASFGEEREPEGTGRGELWAIYVHPKVWSKGAGYRMWTHFEAHRKRYAGCVVWALSQNLKAILFYEGLGFQKDGATKDFNFGGKSFPELRLFLE